MVPGLHESIARVNDLTCRVTGPCGHHVLRAVKDTGSGLWMVVR